MLNGAVCLTDSSEYLKEILLDEQNVLLYELSGMDQVPDKIRRMLDNPDRLREISEAGYEAAAKGHTWKERAKVLEEWFE